MAVNLARSGHGFFCGAGRGRVRSEGRTALLNQVELMVDSVTEASVLTAAVAAASPAEVVKKVSS